VARDFVKVPVELLKLNQGIVPTWLRTFSLWIRFRSS
jgi:hypothetical protein